ncbi:helix-turn-helix domain-containing protein [Catellatospora sichuanensis]|uniref:helix-turn-helix domain-containing protein n=1 Tax=Catellatospora sichuanensis TaxID=1969805 RepID=UPI0011823E4B|nr:LysR family transcriptional regulator [Catellatospora sichuanensis]
MHCSSKPYNSVTDVQLRALIAVADEGTFTDAAVALGIAQAAFSWTITALEAELGVRLLRRTTRLATLTSVGARVIDRARQILRPVAEWHGSWTTHRPSGGRRSRWSAGRAPGHALG